MSDQRAHGSAATVRLAESIGDQMIALTEAVRPDVQGAGMRFPAEVVLLLTELRRIAAGMQATCGAVSAWLEDAVLDGRLRVDQRGPATDPFSAVCTAATALAGAGEGCRATVESLRKAKMATSGLAVTVAGPRRARLFGRFRRS